MNDDSDFERHSRTGQPDRLADPDEIARTEARNALFQYDHVIRTIRSAAANRERFRLRVSLILELNRLATEGLVDTAGVYRHVPMMIEGSKHVPPERFVVPELVDELCDYVNDNWKEKSPIHLAAYCMWRLNWIHPFADGNGRTARALSYLVLCARLGYELPGQMTIPDQIANDKRSYYAALVDADRRHDRGEIDVSRMERLLERSLEVQLSEVRQHAVQSGASTPTITLETQSTPTITLERLELANFRGFESLTIDLGKRSSLGGTWSCLAGINGAGKTAVLEAICLALLGDRQALELGSARLSRMRRRDRHGRRHDSRIVVTLSEGGAQRKLELGLDDDGVSSRLLEQGPEYEGGFWKRQRERVLLSVGATRNLSEDGLRASDSRAAGVEVRQQLSLFEPHAALVHSPALFAKQRRTGLFIKLLENLVRQVFPSELAVLERESRVWFEMSDNVLEPLDLPDGYRSSVAWLAELCAIWAEKSPPATQDADPTRVDAVVLIDEIDLHLHASLQRRIVPALRKALPRVQWIVTTHSPMVVSSFSAEEICILDHRTEGGVRRLDREILGFSTDEVFEWLMETPPKSAALDELKRRALDPSNSESAKDLSLLLTVDPNIGAEEAKKLVRARTELASNIGKAKRGDTDL